MQPLSAAQILQAWEIGQGRTSVEQAIALLSVAYPDRSFAQLSQLSIGQRDGELLQLREITFGSQLDGYTECPHCGERLEFQLNVADIRYESPPHPPGQSYETQFDEWKLQFRLPTSQDLSAIADFTDKESAQARLWQRCILQASQQGILVAPEAIPPDAIAQLAADMVLADPQAEVLLPLVCSACQYQWLSMFDIAAFFWTELSAQAQRLLREVHALARFYGWREADILAMSARRRNQYLTLIADG